jgi:hypothetical protein
VVAEVLPNPSVIWRVQRSNGQTAHAVLCAAQPKTRLAWYLDRQLLGTEEFDDPAAAMARAEELRLLVSVGGG